MLAILVAMVGALSATAPLLTLFASYDDEGYVLVMLAHYIKEGHLYTQTSNRSIVRFWDNDEAGVAVLPLAHYVMTEMSKMTEFGEYEIRVHPHRSSPWLQSLR